MAQTICLLTSSYPRDAGDFAGKFIRDLLLELVPMGFRFEVVTPADASPLSPLRDDGICVTRFRYAFPQKLQRLAYGYGIEENLRHSPTLSILIPPFLASFLAAAWSASRSCSLLWSHWAIPAGLAGAAASRLRGIPNLLTLHSAPPARVPAGLFRGPSTTVTAVTRALAGKAARALGIPGNDVPVIPMGVARDVFARSPDTAALRRTYGFGIEPVILSMGRFVRIKGLETLVEAAARVTKPGATLVLAGGGPLEGELRRLAGRLGARVRFEPFLSGVKRLELLALCDIVCVPSVALRGGREEGLPLAVLEGLAAGKPVVATTAGGAAEAIEDSVNGYLVPPGDAVSLAERLSLLASSRELRERLGEAARRSARAFSIESVAARYGALLKGLAAAPRGAAPKRIETP